MAIAQKQRESSARSFPKQMKQWRPPKREKLFGKKLWASNAPTSASYDQGAVDILVLSKGIKSKRTTIDSLYVDVEVQSFVMARAREVQANLFPSNPSLIKVMLPSHVAGGFWLGLPKVFCNRHLPKHDSTIVLEDESGKEYETKYLFEKVGLSAGWRRGFSIAHKLLQGDVLIFHLVMPTKFMVYIVRSNAAAEVDGAFSLLKYESYKQKMPYIKERIISNIKEEGMALDNVSSKERIISNIKEEEMTLDIVSSKEQNISTVKEEANDNPVSLVMDIHEEHRQMSGQVAFDTEMIENDRKDFGFNFMCGIQLSDSTPDFDKVKSLNDFSIFVNGLIIDSEFSKHVRTKYYELCRSQKSFLHDHLLDGLNYKLVSGIISETINIADAIRACKITTSQDYLVTWDKTLKAFEGLGMNVGFLRSRINQVSNLSLKLEKKREAGLCTRGSKHARETIKRLDAEIHNLDIDIENMEQLFQEVASAAW